MRYHLLLNGRHVGKGSFEHVFVFSVVGCSSAHLSCARFETPHAAFRVPKTALRLRSSNRLQVCNPATFGIDPDMIRILDYRAAQNPNLLWQVDRALDHGRADAILGKAPSVAPASAL